MRKKIRIEFVIILFLFLASFYFISEFAGARNKKQDIKTLTLSAWQPSLPGEKSVLKKGHSLPSPQTEVTDSSGENILNASKRGN
ncbi:MAG: hypothetical protein ACE5GL_04550 [Calditrichia bacterium]